MAMNRQPAMPTAALWGLLMLLAVLPAASAQAQGSTWYVPMGEQIVGGFDHIQIRACYPYTFAETPMSAFFGLIEPAYEWSLTFFDQGTNFAIANGPNLGSSPLWFAVWVEGDRTWERPVFQFQAYRDGIRVDNADVVCWGPGELDWMVAPGTWTLSAVMPPYLPGDANLDGRVDVADLGILGASYGHGGKVWTTGDFNGDGDVNVADLGILGANYGRDINGPAAVPEPASLALAGLAAVALLRRRRSGR